MVLSHFACQGSRSLEMKMMVAQVSAKKYSSSFWMQGSQKASGCVSVRLQYSCCGRTDEDFNLCEEHSAHSAKAYHAKDSYN
eukprot:641766-Amphidinium_carterae.1